MPVIALIVPQGVPLLELAIPCEVFGQDRGYLGVDWYELRMCGQWPGDMRTELGFSVRVPYGLDEVARADTVLIPACADIHGELPSDIVAAVRAAHQRGARVASICSGAFILAQAGILDGRRAATHWMFADELARRFPRVRVDADVLYADEGDVLTSAGSGAGLDLCLHILRRDFGARVANAVARRLVLPPHRDGGQSQYVELAVPEVAEDSLAPVLEWALRRLDQPLTVAEFARQAAMSPRTLLRRFRAGTGGTPQAWLTAQRLRRARQLLEESDLAIEEVTRRCGFASAASLRSHFSRALGVSPQEYRRTFRAGVAR